MTLSASGYAINDDRFNHIPINGYAGVQGDPHFTGFNGEIYDVMAEPDRCYNLFSSSCMQVNARYAWCEAGTYMSEIGIIIDSGPADTQALLVTGAARYLNGRKLPGMKGAAFNLGETLIAWGGCECKRLRVWHESLHVWVVRDLQNVRGCPAYFLNVVVGADDFVGQTHGLLGVTFGGAKDPVPGCKQGEGVIEGVYQDYEVSSIFGRDCRFNLFENKKLKAG